MSPHVFISYSRKDTDIMKQMRDRLRAAGLDVWTDEDIPKGVDFRKELENAIDKAECFVLICSPNSHASEMVQAEINHAGTRRKSRFPVLARGEPINSVPFELRTFEYTDIRKKANFEPEMKKLISEIQKCIKNPPPPPPPPVDERSIKTLMPVILLVAAIVLVGALIVNNWLTPGNPTPTAESGISTAINAPVLTPSPLEIASSTPLPVLAASPQTMGELNAELSRLFPSDILPDCAEAGDNADAARGDVNLYFDRGQHDRALGCARRVYELQGEQAISDQQHLIELGQCQDPTVAAGLGGKNFLDKYMALSNVGNSLYVAGKSYRALDNLIQAAAVWDALIQQFNCAWVGDGITMWSPAREAQNRLILLTPRP